MMDPVTVLYGLAILGFVAGVAIAYRLITENPDLAERGAFKYLMIIPAFAGLSYVVMFFDLGTLTVGGRTIVLPRYVDWLVTTPVLVGYVGFVAGAPRKWIIGLGLADAFMIATGAVATVTTGPVKWAFFAVSGLGHLSLLTILYTVLPRFLPAYHKRRSLFKLLQNHVGLLWLAYPVVWLVSPAGIGLMSGVGLALIVAYLDVVAKTPYVYFVYRNQRAFADPEAAVGGTAPTTGSSGEDTVGADEETPATPAD
ncbi:MAG: bacteriorhodopsin [Halorientalis sp.]